MKKNVFWMALISLVVMMSSTVFISCSEDDDEKDEALNGSLVGEWIDEDQVHYIINEDGTWRSFSSAYPGSDEGTYVYKDGVLSLYIDGELIFKAKVIKLTATEAVLEATYGGTGRMTLKRVK
jgi:hypothetical protein